ncbi:MAG: 50S ribosomal protein L32 [Candidatus Aminicenantes bacterium]|nr:50S ribosomal protein L32 [Candidatus Aminicenantes bacterium]NIM83382.1 50S ribosomal protein L32 [Candidatus Aminicenantes bacterium]NIN22774.1 50S ribosomal protein L32 [Candidatus Aminicenantes bacterium]NIN46508.1 50S ribosomal protein L32 [Candidatus Aminicenantes bacterium]NIN89413.1 50S ribosomal protein L32 [Candidatus Aminicenantes bacterium]
MALPKRRHSHQRTHKRRSHQALKIETLSSCPQCNEPKLPHRACKSCGYYGGRQVIKAEEE